MNSRTAINLLLLALVAVLGTLAFFKPGLEEKPASVPITDIQSADVAKIRIDRAVMEDVAFERRNGKWWMTEPVAAPANALRMDGVLRIASAESKRQYPAAQVDAGKIGLEQPDVTLALNEATKIAFGDSEPLTRARYVRVGDTVHLIEDTGYYHVIGTYTTFIDRALLPEGAVIEGLTFPGLKLTREDQHWRATPEPKRFTADSVNKLLDEWRLAEAMDLQRYNGGKAQGEIVVTLKDRPEPLRFVILSRQPELVLARTDLALQYHLPEDAAERLLKLPEPAPEPAPEAPATTEQQTQ